MMKDPDENSTDEYASWAAGEAEVRPAMAGLGDFDPAALERALDADNDAFDDPDRDERGREPGSDPVPDDR